MSLLLVEKATPPMKNRVLLLLLFFFLQYSHHQFIYAITCCKYLSTTSNRYMWRSKKEVRNLRLKVVKKQHMRRILCKWFLRLPKAVTSIKRQLTNHFVLLLLKLQYLHRLTISFVAQFV